MASSSREGERSRAQSAEVETERQRKDVDMEKLSDGKMEHRTCYSQLISAQVCTLRTCFH